MYEGRTRDSDVGLHQDLVAERNRHDGDADSPLVVSFNDLSGPKGKPTANYDGPMPFPEPEPKPRPQHKYTACAYTLCINTFDPTKPSRLMVVAMGRDAAHAYGKRRRHTPR